MRREKSQRLYDYQSRSILRQAHFAQTSCHSYLKRSDPARARGEVARGDREFETERGGIDA